MNKDTPASIGPEDAEQLVDKDAPTGKLMARAILEELEVACDAADRAEDSTELVANQRTKKDEAPRPQALSDTELLALCPKTMKPSETQLALVRAYVSSDHKAHFADIVDGLGLPRTTVRSWFHRRAEMHIWLRNAMLHSMDVAAVWRAVKARAIGGSDRAAHMLLMRYDPDYAAAQGKGLPTLKGDTGPSRADVEAAEHALSAGTVATEHSADGPVSARAVGREPTTDGISCADAGTVRAEGGGGGGEGGGGIPNMSPQKVDAPKPIPEKDDSEEEVQ